MRRVTVFRESVLYIRDMQGHRSTLCIRCMHRIREISRSPWATLAHDICLGWNKSSAEQSSEKPSRGESEGTGHTGQTSSASIDRQHEGNASTIIRTPRQLMPQGKDDEDNSQTVRCTSTEPANTKYLKTAHTPERNCSDSHHQTSHAPRALRHARKWRRLVAQIWQRKACM